MTVRSMRATTLNATSSTACRRVETRLVDAAGEPGLAATLARHTALAREVYAERRRRHKFLPADLFGEPTWDILLDLYIAAREDRRVPTTSACIGAHVPPTTALRWLRILEARDLVEREDDGRDGRRTFVRLTAQGLAAMDKSLASLDKNFTRIFDRSAFDAEASVVGLASA
ncbi:winged helix DNA-binding protein [Novosphingobium sp. SL115]|uniref:winged helix DNA-binding protein n=1 Tax=Novosphingobium sp. SL115 TaxID=2995150 RepID=UPI0022736E00|nr:winged helix DNA-binding protein [Novosphingobium sp. SL115]MCY1672510.1 winged helix DNA-binding protein [Novosphingobium sp. SL115]